MTTTDDPGRQRTSDEAEAHGVTRGVVQHFFYRGFRYGNLADALAQARRDRGPSADAESLSQVDEMASYGITQSSSDCYWCDGFRYTTLEDALAQARRGACQAERVQ